MEDFYCDEVLSGETSVETVIETDNVLAYHHTRPFWETHIVVIPKTHVDSLLTAESDLLAELLDVVKTVADEIGRSPARVVRQPDGHACVRHAVKRSVAPISRHSRPSRGSCQLLASRPACASVRSRQCRCGKWQSRVSAARGGARPARSASRRRSRRDPRSSCRRSLATASRCWAVRSAPARTRAHRPPP